ncbi:hypothetical protein EDB81DRAFT_884840 [Dactylonectria macrodidyma]|uniref:Uncharacterized protein n=1 Tax=Dactylonectria macrodidyma TaxID=307937 RepID=A0A9P9ELN4_9HYPO|nr:hypothetical protein EDB81DRAFT_884840 [Dactylonectria macrodidyma]
MESIQSNLCLILAVAQFEVLKLLLQESQNSPLASQTETEELKRNMELIKGTIKSQTDTIYRLGNQVERLQRLSLPQASRHLPPHYLDLVKLGMSVKRTGDIPTRRRPQTQISPKVQEPPRQLVQEIPPYAWAAAEVFVVSNVTSIRDKMNQEKTNISSVCAMMAETDTEVTPPNLYWDHERRLFESEKNLQDAQQQRVSQDAEGIFLGIGASPNGGRAPFASYPQDGATWPGAEECYGSDRGHYTEGYDGIEQGDYIHMGGSHAPLRSRQSTPAPHTDSTQLGLHNGSVAASQIHLKRRGSKIRRKSSPRPKGKIETTHGSKSQLSETYEMPAALGPSEKSQRGLQATSKSQTANPSPYTFSPKELDSILKFPEIPLPKPP